MSFEPQSVPAGYKRLLSGGRRLLPTSDGHLSALPYTVAQWRAFFAAVGRDDVLPGLGVATAADVNAKGGQLYAAMVLITPLRIPPSGWRCSRSRTLRPRPSTRWTSCPRIRT